MLPLPVVAVRLVKYLKIHSLCLELVTKNRICLEKVLRLKLDRCWRDRRKELRFAVF